MQLDIENYRRHFLLDTKAETSAYFFFPVLYGLHKILEENAGIFDETNNLILPTSLRLTKNTLEPNGIYLLDTGMDTFFWLGTDCNPKFAKSVQNIIAGINSEEIDDFRIRIDRIIQYIQQYFFIICNPNKKE